MRAYISERLAEMGIMEDELRILILEDSESDAGLVIRTLKKANFVFDNIRVDTREEFIEALDNYMPHVILSDHSLPQFNSLEAYKIYKERNLKIPFILITGSVSEEFAVRCLHEGIDDYILKDNLTRLPSALQNAIDKKHLEAKKHELELEQLEITEKLKHQNDELVKTNKELDRFVYSASHELRGPLASMLGLLQLTSAELSEKRYDQFDMYLKMIGMSVGRLNIIVEEIVNYSINNRTEVRRELIDIKELTNKVFEKLSYISGIETVEKIVEIDQTHDWYCDKRRLMTILDNLLSNAIFYRNKESLQPMVKIKVHVHKTSVVLTVEDNGIGIESCYHERIFDMFFRVSSLSQGSGLGLYIVQETLEKLEASISVASELDKGSTFKLVFKNLL